MIGLDPTLLPSGAMQKTILFSVSSPHSGIWTPCEKALKRRQQTTLPFKSPAKVIEVVPLLDSNYANSGEILVDGTTGSEVASALMMTPGYEVELKPSDHHDPHFRRCRVWIYKPLGIYGTRRIRG